MEAIITMAIFQKSRRRLKPGTPSGLTRWRTISAMIRSGKIFVKIRNP